MTSDSGNDNERRPAARFAVAILTSKTVTRLISTSLSPKTQVHSIWASAWRLLLTVVEHPTGTPRFRHDENHLLFVQYHWPNVGQSIEVLDASSDIELRRDVIRLSSLFQRHLLL